ISPKPVFDADVALVIESTDVHTVTCEEAATEPWMWSALMWGGRRDLEFVRWLGRQHSLLALGEPLRKRKGIVRSNRGKRQVDLLGRRTLETPEFPPDTFLR